MSDSSEKVAPLDRPRRLADAIRDVKNAGADRDDVVIEMREAERMRLELFAAEIAPIIAEVPKDMDLFDFAISQGLQPRFWIDATSHVSMGRDKRTFRFLKDTRLGRVVLAESSDMKTVANQVTRYLAERIVERQRLMEGDIVALRPDPEAQPVAATQAVADAAPAKAVTAQSPHTSWKPLLANLGLVLLGAAVGLAATLTYYWDQIDLSRLGF
jgi:hypothetical protein